jgi:hypothetical protein
MQRDITTMKMNSTGLTQPSMKQPLKIRTNHVQMPKKESVWWVSMWNTRYGSWDCDMVKARTAQDATWWFFSQDTDRAYNPQSIKVKKLA